MRSWADVEHRLSRSRGYWLTTTNPDGSPHAVPLWAVWVRGALYFDGPPTSRWARNIARDPRVSVNLERADDAVIVEGRAEDLETDDELGREIVAVWVGKYGDATAPLPSEQGLFRLRPVKAKIWSESLADGTAFDGAAETVAASPP
jgi:hypothetical protein